MDEAKEEWMKRSENEGRNDEVKEEWMRCTENG